jgi:hypothetical protein
MKQQFRISFEVTEEMNEAQVERALRDGMQSLIELRIAQSNVCTPADKSWLVKSAKTAAEMSDTITIKW